jgi:hypothetical protein
VTRKERHLTASSTAAVLPRGRGWRGGWGPTGTTGRAGPSRLGPLACARRGGRALASREVAAPAARATRTRRQSARPLPRAGRCCAPGYPAQGWPGPLGPRGGYGVEGVAAVAGPAGQVRSGGFRLLTRVRCSVCVRAGDTAFGPKPSCGGRSGLGRVSEQALCP